MKNEKSKIFFDGHLDLAYLAETGRDLTRPTEDFEPAARVAVTLPALAQGGVGAVLGTVFIQQRSTGKGPANDVDGPWCFSSPNEAHACCLRQLAIYQEWHRAGWIELFGASRAPGASSLPAASRGLYGGQRRIRILLLLEGASGIRHVADLDEFHAAGVRVVALTWLDGTIWAGGDQSGGGITAAGRELVARIDELQMVHDVSHLSERAFWELFDSAGRPKIASHSNCRVLLPGKQYPERHLSDDQIRAIANAGGMIGINLFSKFLVPSGRATIADVITHIKHMSQLAGRADFIGLGSDMDGGFNADGLPGELDHPRHLDRLLDAMAKANFSDADINGFAYDNWNTFFNRHLAF